jgi:hypothetical protein
MQIWPPRQLERVDCVQPGATVSQLTTSFPSHFAAPGVHPPQAGQSSTERTQRLSVGQHRKPSVHGHGA